MLDLAKPLGIHEGLVFYGDHELADLVYYFPDEVSLAPQSDASGGTANAYELFFQVFHEGDIVEGSLEDLRKTAGAILSLGIRCSVEPRRLEKALQQLKASWPFPGRLVPSVPPWKDGAVNLMVLDAITDKAESISEEAFVKSIVGAKKPSLMSGDLKSIFNVRLDRRGTALVLAALEGEAGNVAGVLYDLKYTAIRPALDLRIWANLGRCYDSVAHQLGVKAEFTWGVKFSLGAELAWLTKKMEEDGDLKIEILSQVEDAETKKMIDEMVQEFKDSILKEMFKPFVSPQTTSVINMEGLVPVVGVSYKFTREKIAHDKVIEVDYRERSAVVRTHNPQSHLWVLGRQIAANRLQYIRKVVFSDVWREQSLSIQMTHNFDDPQNDLLSAEVLVWRSRFGVAEREGRFALPEGAEPLKDITLHKGGNGKQQLAWVYEKEEPVGYYYQIRFVYSGTADRVSSPREILTKPLFSTSQDLVIFPETYMFYKVIEVREGNISFSDFRAVDVTLRLKDAAGQVLDVETITLKAEQRQQTWIVRGKDRNALFVEYSREYHYADDRPSVKTEPLYLQGDEVIVNKPFQRSVFSLLPVLAVPPGHNIREVLLELSVHSPALDEPVKELHRIKGPQFDVNEIRVKLHSDKDTITFGAKAVTADGRVLPLAEGPVTTNALVLDLKKAEQNEVVFVWRGRSPEALGLKQLMVELRQKGDPAVALEAIEYRGAAVPQPVTKVFPVNQQIEWRLLKRFLNGSRERGDFQTIQADEVIINAE